MKINFNDKEIEIASGSSLQDLLTQQGVPLKGIATAVNETVIPSKDRPSHILQPGDSVIIITAFYGG